MNKNLKLLSAVSVIGLSLFLSDKVANAEDSFSFETTNNSIDLDWADDAEYYEIYLNDNIIWSGTDDSYTISELDPSSQYHITLAKYDEDKNFLDFDYYRISTKDNANVMRSIDEESIPGVQSYSQIHNNEEVEVSWSGYIPNDSDVYRITRDGEEIGESSNKSFTDKNVTPGEDYLYQIHGKTKVEDSKIEEGKKALENENIEITDETLEALSYEPYTVARHVSVPENDLEQHLSTQNLVETRFGIQYTTFLQDEYAPIGANDIWEIPANIGYMGGDNRGFDMFNDNFRTRSNIYANFDLGIIGPDFANGANNSGIQVGPTSRYDRNYNLIDTTTQTDYRSEIVRSNFSGGVAQWRYEHSVGVPLFGGAPPNIDYDIAVSINRNGSGSINGSHDQAPSHEIGVYIPYSGVNATLYTFEERGIQYLAPVFPQANYRLGF
ncbi:hypothetical protein ABC345_01530 [Shouchella sp. 1P09AA]|uniref:hypothetical protein n=1 Tax=unclassified Shouchella TaxID=2893065 RepID=UPI0035BFDCCC